MNEKINKVASGEATLKEIIAGYAARGEDMSPEAQAPLWELFWASKPRAWRGRVYQYWVTVTEDGEFLAFGYVSKFVGESTVIWTVIHEETVPEELLAQIEQEVLQKSDQEGWVKL